MRDPKRIPQVLQLLEKVWADSPDQRLGQLLMNAAFFGGWTLDDIWNCEDDKFVAGLTKLAQKETKDVG